MDSRKPDRIVVFLPAITLLSSFLCLRNGYIPWVFGMALDGRPRKFDTVSQGMYSVFSCLGQSVVDL